MIDEKHTLFISGEIVSDSRPELSPLEDCMIVMTLFGRHFWR